MNPWSGAMYTGWLLDEKASVWYYLRDDGTMAAGELLIDGTWYTFSADGNWIG